MLNHCLPSRFCDDMPRMIIVLGQQGSNEFLFKFVDAVKQSALVFETLLRGYKIVSLLL
jgi:hypothetical protein